MNDRPSERLARVRRAAALIYGDYRMLLAAIGLDVDAHLARGGSVDDILDRLNAHHQSNAGMIATSILFEELIPLLDDLAVVVRGDEP